MRITDGKYVRKKKLKITLMNNVVKKKNISYIEHVLLLLSEPLGNVSKRNYPVVDVENVYHKLIGSTFIVVHFILYNFFIFIFLDYFLEFIVN